MIVIVATTHIAAESVEDFRVLAEDQIVASRAEDGCIHYSCSEAIETSGVFHWTEVWRDLESFNIHAEAAHHQEYLRTLSTKGKITRSAPAAGTYFDAEPIEISDLPSRGFSLLAVPNVVPAEQDQREAAR